VDGALVAALADDVVEVAVAAASALGARGDMRARLALLEVLRNSKGFYHPLVRAAAVTALGELLGPDEAEPLLDAVGDQDAEVSVAAIAALAAARVAGAADRLLLLLEEVSGYYLPTTRMAAARALAALPGVDRERLARLREHERDPEVRQLLERIGAGRSVA
jgi:HEAT repeat protein